MRVFGEGGGGGLASLLHSDWTNLQSNRFQITTESGTTLQAHHLLTTTKMHQGAAH